MKKILLTLTFLLTIIIPTKGALNCINCNCPFTTSALFNNCLDSLNGHLNPQNVQGIKLESRASIRLSDLSKFSYLDKFTNLKKIEISIT